MGGGNGQAERDRQRQSDAQAAADRAAAQQAIGVAAKPDELEARRRAHVLALDKWAHGESGPIDVRNMPGADVSMGLYNDALKVHDAGRVGRGLGTMGDTTNPNFVAALGKENEQARHMAASGALEENVNNAIDANTGEMTGLYNTANARNMNIAGLESGNYQSAANRQLQYLLRPKQPNFFRQLALSLAGPVSQAFIPHPGGVPSGGGGGGGGGF